MTARKKYINEGNGKNGWDYEGTSGDDEQISTSYSTWEYWRGGDGDDILISGGDGYDSDVPRGGVGRGSDILHGENGNDRLIGGLGDDTLVGGDGNDILKGRAGADWLEGSAGIDTAIYGGSTEAVTVTLGGDAGSGGSAEGDILRSIENLVGSGHNDTLNGDGVGNVIEGGTGDDSINGYGGADTLVGGDGNDIISGGADDDILFGGAGADNLDGGDGMDTASYEKAQSGVDIDLSAGTGSNGVAEGDRLVNIEHVTGTNYDDQLTGDSANNILNGLGGNDRLEGGAGNDRLDGGEGDDFLDGGAGNDHLTGSGQDILRGGDGADRFVIAADSDVTLSYEGSDAGVSVYLNSNTASGGDAQGDVFTNVTRLIGSDHGDSLTGNSEGNRLDGGAARDVIYGLDGNDTLNGDEGNDVLVGGNGDDNISGGDGDDTLVGLNGADLMTGGAGADRFYVDYIEDQVANLDDDGNDVITDFSIADGDKLVLNTTAGDETTLTELGLSVSANAEDATDADIIQNLTVIATLVDVDYTDITDDNFASYFDVV